MGNRNLIFIGLALAIGLVAVILANSYFSGVEEQQERVAQEQRLARIVVATQPLAFGQPLTAENLRLANFPANSVPQGAFTSIEDAVRGGRVALRPIVPNEPVLADKVSGTDGRAVLASNLAPGMRAMSIPVNAVTGVSGFVRPGDTVDVLLTRTIPGAEGGNNLMTDILLERVKVLAIDQNPNEKDTNPQVGSTAVVEVDLYQAQKLVLAEKTGSLSLLLRNVASQEPLASSPVTIRDLGSGGERFVTRTRSVQTARSSAPRGSGPPIVFATTPVPAGAATVQAGPRRPGGQNMTVYRGVDATEESVGRLGGS